MFALFVRRAVAVAGFVAGILAPANAAATPPPQPIATWSSYLTGTWTCRSGPTPYTVKYAPALGGRWIRGINTSKASQSEDMLTYDAHASQWTLFDMEPTGTWFAMHGRSDASKIALTDAATRFAVSIHKITANEYHLEFPSKNGKPPGKPDVCKRAGVR